MPHTINIITLFRSGVNSNFSPPAKKILKKCLTNETHGAIMTKLSKRQAIKVGVDCGEGPPVPIPNTEVKLACAEDTRREAARKNK